MSNPWDDDYQAETAIEQVVRTDDLLGTPVNLTLKAGKGYEAPWIGFQGVPLNRALKLFDQHSGDISKLMAELAGASQEFQKQAKKFGVDLPPSRTYGKPAGANHAPPPANSDDPPFDTGTKDPEIPMYGCEHGTRRLVEHGGKKGHVCPLPKGAPGRCEVIFEN